MKPKKKNEKPKADKVSAEAEAKFAAQKAEEAREKIAAARNLQPAQPTAPREHVTSSNWRPWDTKCARMASR